MIEPLRFRPAGPKSNARLYREVNKRPDCAVCRVRHQRQRQAKWVCEDCRGKPLCHECDYKTHLKPKKAKHRRHLLVTGHPWKIKTVHEGDNRTYPKTFDWVKINYQAKVGSHMVDNSHWHGQALKFQAGCSGPCLHVQILGCDGIHAADLMGFSDPYIAVFWNDKLVGQTPVRIMTLKPRWTRETFVLPLSPELTRAHNYKEKKALAGQRTSLPTFRAELYDYDAFSKNDFLGQVAFSEMQLFRLLKKNEDAPARRFKLKPKSARGTVGVGLQRLTHPVNKRQSLYIRVCNAENLARSDAFSLSDPYVKIFFNNKFVGKTSVEFDTIDPVWPVESAQFEIPLEGEESLETSKIRLEIYDHDTIGGHDSLGETLLAPSDIRELIDASEWVLKASRKKKNKKKKKPHTQDSEGDEEGSKDGEESKEDELVDVTEQEEQAAEDGAVVKKKKRVTFVLPEKEPNPEQEGEEGADEAQGAVADDTEGEGEESDSSDSEDDEEADLRAAQWSETYGKLSCSHLLRCCKRKAPVDVVDLSKGLLGYGRKKMRKRDLDKFKRFFPLHFSEEAACKSSVKGSMTMRLIYSEFGTVVRGLDLGVRSMSVGEKATIKVRNDYAYAEGFGTHEVPPGAHIDYRVELLSLNGRGARYYLIRRRVVRCVACVTNCLFAFQTTWLKVTGCPIPECLCPCCYIEASEDAEALTPAQREEHRIADDISYEDSVEESVHEKRSLLDEEEALTAEEIAALSRKKNRGLFSLFSRASVLEREAAIAQAEGAHEAVVRQQHNQEEAHAHDHEHGDEEPAMDEPQAQEMER